MPTDQDLRDYELEKANAQLTGQTVSPTTSTASQPKKQSTSAVIKGSGWADMIEAGRKAQTAYDDEKWTGEYNGFRDEGPRPDRWGESEIAAWKGLEPGYEIGEMLKPELPEGAIGWNEHGQPFYGGRTPFQEWQLQAHANMKYKPQVTAEEASWDDWQAPKISDAYEQEGIGGAAKALLAGAIEGYDQISESLDYVLAGGDEERNDLQNAWQTVSHWGAETLQRAGSLAYQTKLFFGGVGHVVEEAFQIGSAVGDQETHFTDRYNEIQAQSNQFTIADKPELMFWRDLGVDPKWIDEYQQGALAGRMFYSTIWDNTVDRIRGISGTGQAGNLKKEEFLRRMQEDPNLNPNLEVAKYENPGAEMFGEIIFDPLNVFEWGFKGIASAAAVRKAAILVSHPMPKVKKFLNAMKLTRVSGFVDDAEAAAHMAGLISARVDDVADIVKADTKWAKSKVIFGLTNDAKAHVTAQDLSRIEHWVWENAKTIDGKFDVAMMQEINTLIMKSAGNESEILEAINGLSRFNGWDIVFSEAGTRSAVMMRDLWTPGKMKKIREVLNAHPDDYMKGLREAVELSDSMIADQTKKFFPDIIDPKYDGGKGAKGGWKLLAKTHDYLYNRGPYKWFNKMFSAIYLGLNPGYAARNVMQNSVQALLDEGIGGVFGFNTLDNLTAWGSDITPLGAITEFGSVAAGETNVANKSRVFFASTAATWGEKQAGLKIFGRVYPRTMKQLLSKALDFKELQKFGFTKQESKLLYSLMIEHKGDVNKVFEILEEGTRKGFIDVSKNTLAWTDDMIRWGDETGMTQPIIDALVNSASKEDAVKTIRREFQKAWDAGEGVVDDFPVVNTNNIAVDEVLASAEHMDAAGYMSKTQDEHKYLTTYHGMNDTLLAQGETAAVNYKGTLIGQMKADGLISSANEGEEYLVRMLDGVNLEGTNKRLSDFLNAEGSKELQRVQAESKKALDRYFATADVFKGKKGEIDLKKIYMEWGLDEVLGPYSGVLSKEDIWHEVWLQTIRSRRPIWEAFRDEKMLAVKQMADIWRDAAIAKGAKNIPDIDITKLTKTYEKARLFDKFLDMEEISRPLRLALDRQDTVGVAVQFARMFGISSHTGTVSLNEKIVNIINSKLGKNFNEITELAGKVPPREIAQAMMAHALEETVQIYRSAGAEGWAALRRVVKGGSLSEADMRLIESSLDVVRFHDRELAKSIENMWKRRDYLVKEMARQGRRKTPATRLMAQEEIGNLEAKLDDLLDEAQKMLEDAGAGRNLGPDSVLRANESPSARAEFIRKYGEYPEATKPGYVVLYRFEQSGDVVDDMAKNGIQSKYWAGAGDSPAGVVWAADSPTGYGDYNKPMVAFQIKSDRVTNHGGHVTFTGDVPAEDVLRTYKGVEIEGEWFREDWILNSSPQTNRRELFLNAIFGEEVPDITELDKQIEQAEAALLNAQGLSNAKNVKNAQERLDILKAQRDELVEAAINIEDAPEVALSEAFVQGEMDQVIRNNYGADMAWYSGENVASTSRQWYERRDVLREMEEKFVQMVDANWGRSEKVQDIGRLKQALNKSKKYVLDRTSESRQISNVVALNKRNFILHDYAKKRNFDLALSYVMPYHFWYNRTYAAWLQRTVTHPGTITAYLDYKDAMAKMHADLPPWWRYSLNTNELLGIDSENPFYFHLEQTLSPLNGLTGMDFNDEDKNYSWYAKLMQEVGKWGPSIYTPIAWGLALDAYRRGEEEAVAKWAGRSIPQTQAIKALTAKMGFGPGGSGFELDPGIWLASGGVDVWESRRIGRALGWAVDNGILTPEQAQQAAMDGPGNPDYDNARGEAQSLRSGGQLSSFFFGTGFKARTPEDIEIDQMDAEYARFLQVKESMTKDQVIDAYRYFSEKYPFFNTLQIARRDRSERDTSYAFNVLSRIPPGQTKEAFRAMGLEREQVNEFWEKMEIPKDWTERERVNFVSAIYDVGTMLAMPDDATRDEWDDARSRNSNLYAKAEQLWGEETVELVDIWWDYVGTDKEKADALRAKYPQIDEYNDFLTMGKSNDPILAKYYASFDSLRYKLRGDVFTELAERYPDYSATNEKYQELRLTDAKAAKQFKEDNPVISSYQEDKAYLMNSLAKKLADYGDYLPERTPEPTWREDAPIPEAQTQEQQKIWQAFGQPEVPAHYRWSWEDWQAQMSPALGRLVEDVVNGTERELSYTAEQSLEYTFRDLEEDPSMMIELMSRAYPGFIDYEKFQATPPGTAGVGEWTTEPTFITFEDGSKGWAYVAFNGEWIKADPPKGYNEDGTKKTR